MQLAGYGRHRTVFRSSGEEGMDAAISQERNYPSAVTGLRAELDKDLNRLWRRNLGACLCSILSGRSRLQ